MKNILIFLLSVIVISVFSTVMTASVMAATGSKVQQIGGTESAKVTSAGIDYQLPYPGILTDHPLYIFKALRDRLTAFFITDPVKKIDFYILQSDKFFVMGMRFFDMGKLDKAKDAFARSTAATRQAVDLSSETNKGVNKVPVMTIEHIRKSLTKHEELLTEMGRTRSGQQKDILTSELEQTKKIQANVDQTLMP